jgi:hypothetical protein
LPLTRNSSSRKSSGFAEGNWLRADDRIQHNTPSSPVQFSYLCAVASCIPCRLQLRPYHGIKLGNSPRSSADSERVEAMRLERPSGQASGPRIFVYPSYSLPAVTSFCPSTVRFAPLTTAVNPNPPAVTEPATILSCPNK